MQSDKSSESTPGVTFIAVSMVKCPEMKSQWQAGFFGVFPVNCTELPATHPSDKTFFKEHWQGDNYTTYEEHIGKNK